MSFKTLKRGKSIDAASSIANIPQPTNSVIGPPKQHLRGKGSEIFPTTSLKGTGTSEGKLKSGFKSIFGQS